MKVKNANLEWKVLIHDFNTKQIREYNVFSQEFVERLHKAIRKKQVTNFLELKNFINSHFLYHYWCKYEYEIAVGGLFVKSVDELEKIDAYTQLKMNLDRITEYVNTELRINF